jgi:periplasmic protein TonB
MTILFFEDRGELLRWALSGVAVVFLHGAVAAAMLNWEDESVSEPTAAMVVDLAPFPTAPPENISGLPLGPLQAEAQESQHTPVAEEKEEVEETVETSQSREVQPELAQAVNPEVALDTTPPKPEQKVEKPQENQLPSEAMAPPEMPEFEMAEVAAAQVQGAPSVERSTAIPDWWRNSISERLERNKRYPAEAKNIRGTAQVAFSIDRKGRVMSSRIAASSGSDALDREALEMVKRAQPFPTPPASVSDTALSFTVPVRFNMK